MSGQLTDEQLARVAELERRFNAGELISMAESLEYIGLKDIARRLTGPAELSDDPKTWFVDESRRPDVVHGGDYNAVLHQMRCEEAKDILAALLRRVGPLAFDVGMAALKR